MNIEKANELIEEFKNTESIEDQMNLSVELARAVGVSEDRIIHNIDELDAFMASGKPLVLGRV